MNNQIPIKFRLLAVTFQAIGMLMPVTSIPITWILWMITKNTHPFVDRSGRSALNFQTTIALYVMVIAGLLGMICGVFSMNTSTAIFDTLWIPATIFISLLLLASFSLPIIAIVLAIQSKIYSYPLSIKFLSETL